MRKIRRGTGLVIVCVVIFVMPLRTGVLAIDTVGDGGMVVRRDSLRTSWVADRDLLSGWPMVVPTGILLERRSMLQVRQERQERIWKSGSTSSPAFLLVDEDVPLLLPEDKPTVPKLAEMEAPEGDGLMLSESQLEVVQLIWEEMDEAEYSLEQIAGFLGNFYRESALSSEAWNPDGYYGLAQWGGSRLKSLKKLTDYDTTVVQVEFLLIELDGAEGVADEKIRATVTVAEATTAVAKYYERCAWGERERARRVGYAEAFYAQMVAAQEAWIEGDELLLASQAELVWTGQSSFAWADRGYIPW